MSESPSKRRKTSPTTSIPITAPNLQARDAPFPSFASPTRASTVKRDANLARRGVSPSKDRDGAAGVGKNLNNLFAKALGEAQPSIEGTDNGKQGGRAIGGSFAVQPRRISRSPSKQPNVESAPAPVANMVEIANPFQKKGLRRSPVSSQPASVITESKPVNDGYNPFLKRGLRRSPAGSQPSQILQDVQPVQPTIQQAEEPPEPVHTNVVAEPLLEPFSTTPPGLPPSRAIQDVMVTTPEPRARPAQSSDDIIDEPIPPKTALRPSPLFELNVPLPGERNSAMPTEPTNAAQIKQTTPLQESVVIGQERNQTPKQQTEISRPEPTDHPRTQPLNKVFQTELPPATVLGESPRRSPGGRQTRSSARSGRPDEPELPPTPTQRGLSDPIVTTPPTGIHNTPSKRDRARLKKNIKSSPLKPREQRPEEVVAKDVPGVIEVIPRQPEVPTLRPVLKSLDPNAKLKPQRRKSARFLIPEDPHAEKKRERDELRKQLQALQEDIEIGRQETERLRLIRNVSTRGTNVAPTSNNSEKVMAMLVRTTSEGTLPEQSQTRPKTILTSINKFLPFRSRRKVTTILSTATQAALGKPLPSFDPIQPTDPLPFLQAFSPLHYDQTISLIPSTLDESQSTSQPQLQEHSITMSHPSDLFHSRILLTVDTSSHTIHTLEIAQLDPAAKAELSTFLCQKALAHEISVIGWAMGRWAEMAITRAQFWCTIFSEFSDLETQKLSIQAFTSRSKKRKRGHDEVSEVNVAEKTSTEKWTRKDLLLHMGRTSHEISSTDVILRIEWTLKPDWTGEVESYIDALVQVPDTWKAQDERKSLDGITSTFRKLVKEKGPLDAVRCIAALLFSDA